MTLVYISGALVAGIFAGTELDLLPWPFFIAAGLTVLGGLLLRKHPKVIYLFILAALLLGAGRGAASPLLGPPDDIQALSRLNSVQIVGVVEEYPETRGGLTRFRFAIHGYRSGETWVETSGLLLAMAKPTAPMIEGRAPPFFRYGDSLILTGALTEPPAFEDFDWREHLAREGVHHVMFGPEVEMVGSGHGSLPLRWLYRARSEMAASLGRSLPEPHASLSQALLLGIRSGLPSELRDDLAQTGTTHLVAISGLHVGILVGLVSLGSATVLGRRRQLYIIAPLVFVWAYALLTGFSPPVARAAIMATLYLWAIYLGRQRSGLTALSAAAAVMVVIDPDLLAELSFQLSFLAMAGLLLLGPWFRAGGLKLVARHWEPEGVTGVVVKFFVEATAISLAAILATLPVIAINFQFLSPVGLPATLLVLPVMPPALVSVFVVGAAGMVSEAAGQVLSWIAWPWLVWMTGVVGLFARVPGLTVDAGPAASYLSVLYYAVWLGLLWWARRRWPKALVRSDLPEFPTLRSLPRPQLSTILRPKWALFLAASLALFAAIAVGSTGTDQRLRVTALNVGQGDSFLIQAPGPVTMLVDGGPDPDTLVLELGQHLPPWHRKIDLVVLTHPDTDHLSGLTGLMERYEVGSVIQCGVNCVTQGNEADYLVWEALLDGAGITPLEARVGTRVLVGEELGLHILHPPPRPLVGTDAHGNNNSVVFRLEYGETSFLFTGDIEAFSESYLLRQGAPLDSTIMTTPHHGSNSSSTPEFIAAVDPGLVLISSGVDNRHGHPHPETLATLASRVPPERILNTAEVGAIQVETDGEGIWVSTEK